jgi:hypothetical protein
MINYWENINSIKKETYDLSESEMRPEENIEKKKMLVSSLKFRTKS